MSIFVCSNGQQTDGLVPSIPLPLSRRMWTCTNCSYAYNRIWTERCEICEMMRTQPSVTQPSLITLTKTAATEEERNGDGGGSGGGGVVTRNSTGR